MIAIVMPFTFNPFLEESVMFNPGDLVQSKTGGPKLVVLAVNGDRLTCARASDAEKKPSEVPADSVNLYHEDGDFGVC